MDPYKYTRYISNGRKFMNIQMGGILPEPSKGLNVALLDQTICLVSLLIIRVFFSGRFLEKNLVTTVPLSSWLMICSISGMIPFIFQELYVHTLQSISSSFLNHFNLLQSLSSKFHYCNFNYINFISSNSRYLYQGIAVHISFTKHRNTINNRMLSKIRKTLYCTQKIL